MKRAAMVLAMTVTGCAANDAVREKLPVVSIESSRPPEQIQECITVALAPIGGLQVTRESNARVITVGSRAHTLASITIAGENPAKVEVRQAGIFNKRWRNAVRACAANELH